MIKEFKTEKRSKDLLTSRTLEEEDWIIHSMKTGLNVWV